MCVCIFGDGNASRFSLSQTQSCFNSLDLVSSLRLQSAVPRDALTTQSDRNKELIARAAQRAPLEAHSSGLSRFHLWNASLLMPLWLPTLDAMDTESLLSWQHAPLSEAVAALLQPPPQQPDDAGLLVEDDDVSGFKSGCLDEDEEPSLRPFHSTSRSTVAQTTVTAAVNT